MDFFDAVDDLTYRSDVFDFLADFFTHKSPSQGGLVRDFLVGRVGFVLADDVVSVGFAIGGDGDFVTEANDRICGFFDDFGAGDELV